MQLLFLDAFIILQKCKILQPTGNQWLSPCGQKTHFQCHVCQHAQVRFPLNILIQLPLDATTELRINSLTPGYKFTVHISMIVDLECENNKIKMEHFVKILLCTIIKETVQDRHEDECFLTLPTLPILGKGC